MIGFLRAVAGLAFAMVGFGALSMAVGGTDIQLILVGVYATCGTVAVIGIGVISRLDGHQASTRETS